jgi:cytochrome bd-type quinol oxidase subunit 2
MRHETMKVSLAIVVVCITFVVAVLAATKASVSGHWYAYLRLLYLVGFSLALATTWLAISQQKKSQYWALFKTIHIANLVAILLAFGSLPFIEHFVDSSLVSGRSYGSVFWSGLALLLLYGVWHMLAKKYHAAA